MGFRIFLLFFAIFVDLLNAAPFSARFPVVSRAQKISRCTLSSVCVCLAIRRELTYKRPPEANEFADYHLARQNCPRPRFVLGSAILVRYSVAGIFRLAKTPRFLIRTERCKQTKSAPSRWRKENQCTRDGDFAHPFVFVATPSLGIASREPHELRPVTRVIRD